MQVMLREHLVVPRPGPLRRKLLAMATFKRRGWVPAGEQRKLYMYGNPEETETIYVPRGLLPQIQAITPVEVEDQRLQLPPVDFHWAGALREEQAAAVRAMIDQGGSGVIEGMTGAGKTETAMGLLSELRQPALWIVHTRGLAEQAMARAIALYQLPVSAFGMLGDGEFTVGTHLTVALVQTLAQLDPAELEVLAQRFGAVVVDEAQHTPALSFVRVVSQFPARCRIGLTATPDRADGLWPLAMATLGPGGVVVIDPQQLIAKGRIILPTVQLVPTEFQYMGPGDWDLVQRARAEDPGRNQLIAGLAAKAARGGQRVLVLTERVAHARELADILVRRYRVPATAVVGADPSERRELALDQVRRGQAQVLICTKLADEGLDLPMLTVLILAAPGKSANRLRQQVGRVMRSWRGKQAATVYDLVDFGVSTLRAQAEERLDIYRRLGWQVKPFKP